MQSGPKPERFQPGRFRSLHFPLQHSACESRHRHILVPTSLDVADRPALLLGFELASLHDAVLTALHVPAQQLDPDDDANGLDAIGLLHSVVDEFFRAPGAGKPPAPARRGFDKFVEDIVPQRLLDAVHWQGECRGGKAAETIAAYANESAADLVILSARPFRWWLPFALSTERMIERRSRANVIVIRHRARSGSAAGPDHALALLW
jgi:nucleotide-binding universal stress UspA family protein